jgi:hypothetical protein
LIVQLAHEHLRCNANTIQKRWRAVLPVSTQPSEEDSDHGVERSTPGEPGNAAGEHTHERAPTTPLPLGGLQAA